MTVGELHRILGERMKANARIAVIPIHIENGKDDSRATGAPASHRSSRLTSWYFVVGCVWCCET